jgi:hypothetical protein
MRLRVLSFLRLEVWLSRDCFLHGVWLEMDQCPSKRPGNLHMDKISECQAFSKATFILHYAFTVSL